jgi:hypothetical protein
MTATTRRAERKGGISIIRIGLIAGALGLLLIGAGVISVMLDQSSKRSPLEITLYPGAVLWGTSDVRPTSKNVFYRVSDSPENVAAYYQQKMIDHYGNSEQSCVRLPATGNAPGSDTDPNIPPYLFRCMFDNSGFNSSQYTQVEIYPGKANPDPFFNAAGMTVVMYKQQWQR